MKRAPLINCNIRALTVVEGGRLIIIICQEASGNDSFVFLCVDLMSVVDDQLLKHRLKYEKIRRQQWNQRYYFALRAMFYVIWCCRDDLMAYHVDTNSALVRADLVW